MCFSMRVDKDGDRQFHIRPKSRRVEASEGAVCEWGTGTASLGQEAGLGSDVEKGQVRYHQSVPERL